MDEDFPPPRAPQRREVDFPSLRGTMEAVTRALRDGHVDPETAASLLEGQRPKAGGLPIRGLEDARWRRAAPGEVFVVEDADGRVVAALRHRSSDWLYRIWDER